MFIIDDLLLAPMKGVIWICHELYSAAEKELEAEEESITTRLRELYMMLETGAVDEVEFEVQEKVLLDRLELLEQRHSRDDSEPEGTQY